MFTDKWVYGDLPKIKRVDLEINFNKMVSLGSCFARNLTRWLYHNELTKQKPPWDILFNPFSIYYELKRVYEKVDWRSGIIYEQDPNSSAIRCRDPWRTWYLAENEDDLENYNDNFDNLVREYLANASIFLITYGLTEIWSSKNRPDIILNKVPIESIKALKSSEKWMHGFASVHQVIDTIKDTIRIIRDYVSKTCPIILTLSPVPLKLTAADLGIREANTLSKATLCVAIHEASNLEENIFYYPSYETIFALNESKFNTWQLDGRHVTAAAIEIVTKRFLETYYPNNDRVKLKQDFWVPFVNEQGKIIGRLYTDGRFEEL